MRPMSPDCRPRGVAENAAFSPRPHQATRYFFFFPLAFSFFLPLAFFLPSSDSRSPIMCRRMKLVAPDLVRVPATMPTIWPGVDEAALLEDLFGHADQLVGVA